MTFDAREPSSDSPAMSAREVMRLTGFSENFTYQALLDGRIPGRVECGRRVLVNRLAFFSWLEGANPTKGDDAPTSHEDLPARQSLAEIGSITTRKDCT